MVLTLAVAAFSVALAPQRRPALATHVPDVVARGLVTRVGAPSPGRILHLGIELPARNEAGLTALLQAIEDPRSPYYRHYLTSAQFTQAFGPTENDYNALGQFALRHGLHVDDVVANRRVLNVSAPVATIERAFAVHIGTYLHPTETRTFFAPDREPTLDLATPVLYIEGLDDYVLPTPRLVRFAPDAPDAAKPTGSGPSGNFIGSDARAAYYGGTSLRGEGQSVGLFEFGGYNPSDIALYFKKVGQTDNVPIAGIAIQGASVSCTGSCDDSEQALDVEEAISMAPRLDSIRFYVGNGGVALLNEMAGDDKSAQLSCSWGFKPNDQAIRPILEELEAQGQSLLVATGDDGYKLTKGGVWPSDAAKATAVGGTDLATNGPGGAWSGETGWRYSGGGPSPDGIALPNYQHAFVNASNDGSTTLRNVPDIAADADEDNYSCYDGSCSTGNGGTSYAAPLWAGFIALANQQAARDGEPPVGYLNPVLYRLGAKKPGVFHDETSGFNGKYYAVPGYDLVTGLGSPNGTALIEALAGG